MVIHKKVIIHFIIKIYKKTIIYIIIINKIIKNILIILNTICQKFQIAKQILIKKIYNLKKMIQIIKIKINLIFSRSLI